MQSFCRALVELNVLKFVIWILPQLTARSFVSNQSKASFSANQKLAWREFENSNTQPESIDHSYLGSIIFTITIAGIKKALALKKYSNSAIKVLVEYYKRLDIFL